MRRSKRSACQRLFMPPSCVLLPGHRIESSRTGRQHHQASDDVANVAEKIVEAAHQRPNERLNRSSIARLPFASILRVPVPVKCTCVMIGPLADDRLSQSSPVHVNQLFLPWSKTCSGLLQSLANSAPHPVP